MNYSILLRSCLRSTHIFKFGYSPTITGKITLESTTIKRWKHDIEAKKDAPVKFTSSNAYVNYRATDNFYQENTSLPESHNLFIFIPSIAGIAYLIFLRDDIEDDGGKNLFKPLHETVPELAIPLLKSAIAENRKMGLDTIKLEKKLAEYMKEPEKYGGGGRKKLVDN